MCTKNKSEKKTKQSLLEVDLNKTILFVLTKARFIHKAAVAAPGDQRFRHIQKEGKKTCKQC